MEELEAMNMLLRAIGSMPVNSLETSHPDAINAKATLDRMRKQAQQRGWWFNIDYDVMFTRDSAGEIRVSSNIKKAKFQDGSIVIRGGKLYNKEQQSYVFTTNPTAIRIQYELPWEDMPQSLQTYAAYIAADAFIMDETEDQGKAQGFLQKAGLAMVEVKREDLEQGNYNVFNKTRVHMARRGVRPYYITK